MRGEGEWCVCEWRVKSARWRIRARIERKPRVRMKARMTMVMGEGNE